MELSAVSGYRYLRLLHGSVEHGDAERLVRRLGEYNGRNKQSGE